MPSSEYLYYIQEEEMQTICCFPLEDAVDIIDTDRSITFNNNNVTYYDAPVAGVTKSQFFEDINSKLTFTDTSDPLFEAIEDLKESTIIIWYKLFGGSIQPLFNFQVDQLNYVRCYISGSNTIHYEKVVEGEKTIDVKFCRHGGATFTDNRWHSLVITATDSRLDFYANSSRMYTVAKGDTMFSGLIGITKMVLGSLDAGPLIEDRARWLHGRLSCFSIHSMVPTHEWIEDIVGLSHIATNQTETIYEMIIDDLDPYIYFPFEDMLWETHRLHDITYGFPTGGEPDYNERSIVDRIERNPMYPDADERIKTRSRERFYSDDFNTTIMEYHPDTDDANWSFLGYFEIYCSEAGVTHILNIPADNEGASTLSIYVNASGFIVADIKVSDNSIVSLVSDFEPDSGECNVSNGIIQLLVSFDGTDYKLFIDAEEKASETQVLLASQASAELIICAESRVSANGAAYFGISSVAFFKRVVTPEDMVALIVKSETYENVVLNDLPVAFYKLDEDY